MKGVRRRVRGGALTRRLFASGLQQAWQIFGGAGGSYIEAIAGIVCGIILRSVEGTWIGEARGGLAVWRSGGLAVWKDRWRGRRGARPVWALTARRLSAPPPDARSRLRTRPALRRERGCSCAIRLESLYVASAKAMHQSAVSHVPPIQGDTTPRFRIRFPRTIGFHRDVRLIAPCRRSNATSSFGPNRLTAGHAST